MPSTNPRTVLTLAAALVLAGCAVNSANNTTVFSNPDRDLRKMPEYFKADAAKRVYPTTAPAAQPAPFRGEVDYQLDVINLANLSDTNWNDVEVWANGQYVCFIPTFPARMQRGVAFRILYSPEGQQPPLSGLWLQKIELVKDGKIYSVPIFAAD